MACPASIARGGLFTLVDDNSSASFNTASQDGAYSWIVDGTEQLYQQWFWFRVGNDPEQSIDVLPIAFEATSDANFNGFDDTLFVRYQGTGFQLEIRYRLDGGSLLSNSSNISESITIKNQTASPLDFHFFQYTNFDLQGTPGGDTAVFTSENAVQQADGVVRLSETVITPAANHREIAPLPVTIDKLNDGGPTTLSDTPIGVVQGPADLTWAFQWDFVIAPNSSRQISKVKNLNAFFEVPEPSTWVLMSMGATVLLVRARRWRRVR